MSIFGTLFSAGDLEDAAVLTLRRWFPTYLAEVGRQSGSANLPRPTSYQVVADIEDWREQGGPTVLVISPGTTDEPERDAEGRFTYIYALSAAVMIAASDQRTARRYARLYTAAARGILAQQGSLGGVIPSLRITGEEYADRTLADGRSAASGAVTATVQVDDVVTWGAGPIDPDPEGSGPTAPPPGTDPALAWPDWPVVDETYVTIEREPIA